MKKRVISLLIFTLVISLTIIVNAATTGTIELSLNNETIKAGEEFSVVVSGSDSAYYLNTVEYSGINVTDKEGNVSNEISVKEVKPVSNEWVEFKDGAKTYYLYSGGKVNSKQVFKVTFAVNKKIQPGTYNVNIQGLNVYNTNIEDDTTNIGTKSISVKVDDKGEVKISYDSITAENINKNVENSTEVQSSGIGNVVFVIVGALVVISIIGYVLSRKNKKIR